MIYMVKDQFLGFKPWAKMATYINWTEARLMSIVILAEGEHVARKIVEAFNIKVC